MTGTNAELATRARDLADCQPAGSLQRKAALSAAALLAATRTVSAARNALTEIEQADLRQAADDVLRQITAPPTTEGPTR